MEPGILRVTLNQYDSPENCPIRDVLDRISNKWGFMVIAVLEEDSRRFNEIRRQIGDISQRVLTKTLRDLERDGLVARTVFPDSPPKVVYELTRLGRELLVPIKILVDWAVTAHEDIRHSREVFDRKQMNDSAKP